MNYPKTVQSTKAERRTAVVEVGEWWLKGIGLLLKILRCFKTDCNIMVAQPVCVLKPLILVCCEWTVWYMIYCSKSVTKNSITNVPVIYMLVSRERRVRRKEGKGWIPLAFLLPLVTLPGNKSKKGTHAAPVFSYGFSGFRKTP